MIENLQKNPTVQPLHGATRRSRQGWQLVNFLLNPRRVNNTQLPVYLKFRQF